MMEFKELVSPSLTDLFVKEIIKSILSGRMAIGDRLPNERELAKMMKVSRAVINGGISQLAYKGFVEVIPRKGTVVANYLRQGNVQTLQSIMEYNGGRFDSETLDSLYEARINMECHIVRLAAARRTEDDLDQLSDQLALLERIDDPQSLGETTFTFFHLLAVASHNIVYPLLVYGYRDVDVPMLQAIYCKVSKDERLQRLRHLVMLIQQKKEEEAAESLKDTINWNRATFEKHVAPASQPLIDDRSNNTGQ